MSFGKIDAGKGVSWLTEGIGLILKNPAAFGLMGLIFAVINFIPFLGGLALVILGPALSGGVAFAAREEAEGRKAEIAHLFRAFQEPGKIGPMLVLCLPAIVGGSVLLVCGFVFGLGALIGGGLSAANGSGMDFGALGGGVMILCLIAIALMFLIYALQFFAVPRVMLEGIEPFAAMKESLSACLANIGAFLLFGIVFAVAFFVLAVVLMLLPIIGWLALTGAASVVGGAAEYVGWRQVFSATANRMPPPAEASSMPG